MEIVISKHTQERAKERGATEAEIRDVLLTGELLPASHNRYRRIRIYPYDRERFGRYYREKRIEVIYTIEKHTMITVTVYVFYGSWSTSEQT